MALYTTTTTTADNSNNIIYIGVMPFEWQEVEQVAKEKKIMEGVGEMKEALEEKRKKFNEIIGNNVKKEIKKVGSDQKKIAKLLGVSTPTVYKWTSGQTSLDIFTISRLAQILEVKFTEFLYDILEGLIDKKENIQLTEEEIIKLKEMLKEK